MAKAYQFRLTDQDYKRFELMAQIENEYLDQGYRLIAGVDEAGRGPLAGPVTVAACILNPADPIYGLNDSKKLTPKRRDYLYEQIKSRAIAYAVVMVPVESIEQFNILGATKQGMVEAILKLESRPQIVLLDQVRLQDERLPAQRSFIKGDARSNSIAAASILAKVSRDRCMAEYDKTFPGYNFAGHKGYGTESHYQALKELGPCPIHRLSFLNKLKLGQTRVDSGKAKGDIGEKAVATNLGGLGYRLLEHNFWLKHHTEIDLIMIKGQRLAIIEVKARRGNDFEDQAIAALDADKVRRIKHLAEYYVTSRQLEVDDLVFLLASVQLDEHGGVSKIKYFNF